MIGALGAGMLAGLGIAMPIGAIGTYLVSLGAHAPRSVAAAAAVGVATADGIYALLAVSAGAALDTALRPAAGGLRLASVLALLALAALTVRSGWRRYRALNRARAGFRRGLTPARSFAFLLGLTILNPATLAYFTALVLGHQASSTVATAARVSFVLGAFAASAAWQLTLVAGGATLGHFAGGRRGQLAIALTSAAVMTALAVALALG